MFTNEQITQLYRSVLETLLKAGWVREFSFTDGKGWNVGWSDKGALAAIEIKLWVNALGLCDADERPLIFHEVAQGVRLHPASNAKTMNMALKPLVHAGLATHAEFVSGVGSRIDWTSAGEVLCLKFRYWFTELGFSPHSDELLVFFHIIRSLAPDEHSRVVVR